MEELLPLIIGVLWLLYTFYSKSQKKKAREGSSPPGAKTKENPSFLEQLLAGKGIQLESPEPVEYEEDIIYEPFEKQETADTETKEKEIKPFLQSELSEFMGEGHTGFTTAFQDEQSFETLKDISVAEPSEQMQEFDLKKAVVFSEILNAPYIDYK